MRERKESLIGAGIVTTVAYVIGYLMGWAIADMKWEDDAVKAGHAEYYLDENHSRQWRWLPTESEASDE